MGWAVVVVVVACNHRIIDNYNDKMSERILIRASDTFFQFFDIYIENSTNRKH